MRIGHHGFLQILFFAFVLVSAAKADESRSVISFLDAEDSRQKSYEFVVPIIDARGKSFKVIGFSAADASVSGIALVLYGEFEDMYDAANRAVRDARRHDNAPVGIILADAHPALGGEAGMAIYVGAHRMLPNYEEPLAIPKADRFHAAYYTTSMQVSLEAYQEAMQHIEQQKMQE